MDKDFANLNPFYFVSPEEIAEYIKEKLQVADLCKFSINEIPYDEIEKSGLFSKNLSSDDIEQLLKGEKNDVLRCEIEQGGNSVIGRKIISVPECG